MSYIPAYSELMEGQRQHRRRMMLLQMRKGKGAGGDSALSVISKKITEIMTLRKTQSRASHTPDQLSVQNQ